MLIQIDREDQVDLFIVVAARQSTRLLMESSPINYLSVELSRTTNSLASL